MTSLSLLFFSLSFSLSLNFLDFIFLFFFLSPPVLFSSSLTFEMFCMYVYVCVSVRSMALVKFVVETSELLAEELLGATIGAQ